MRQRKLVRRKKRRVRRLRVFFFIMLLMLLGAIGYGGYLVIQTMQAADESYNDLGREKSELREENVSISSDPVSILLMGIEDYSTNGENGRTDTLMVATYNPNNEKLKLLSIPRDTLVEIDGREYKDKINHAHVYGGKKLTIKTIENLLDIPIDYYAAVNFEAFENIIDILGHISVDVPFDFSQDGTKGKKIYFEEGKMNLNGTEALAYARMRKQDPTGDIGRNERQQQIIKAIIEKAVSIGSITKVDNLAKEVGNNIQTNMKVTDGISFVLGNTNFKANNIETISLQTHADRINGIFYQIVDEESLLELKSELKDHLEIKTSNDSFSSRDY